jgi:hypothetical protein
MTPEARTIYKAKMTYNLNMMRNSAASIRENLGLLEKAIDAECMDDMHVNLKRIVDDSVGCRARLQYMRGVYSTCSDMSRGSPA